METYENESRPANYATSANDTEEVYAEVPEEKNHSQAGSLHRNIDPSSRAEEDGEFNDVVIDESASVQHEDRTPAVPARLPSREVINTYEPTDGKQSQRHGRNKLSDSDQRDPQNLQQAIVVNFDDIIAEPKGTHSFNTIWDTSNKVYSVTKFWLYRILTLVFGIPCALFWGIYFALLAFFGVWWILPCIRAISIKCHYLGKLWSVVIRSIVDPIFESIGLMLSRIRVSMTHYKN